MAPVRFAALMYHSVSDDDAGQYTLPWRQFRDHLAWLEAQGYVAEGFGGLQRRIERADWPARYVVLSFDDGHHSFLRAAEVLAEHGFRATFFLTPTLCRQRVDFLKEDGIRQLAALAEVGAHGMTHLPISRLPVEARRRELRDSRRWLEEVVGTEVRFMSAPGGFWDQGCQMAARSEGYQLVGNSVEWWNEPGELLEGGQVNRVALRRHFRLRDLGSIVDHNLWFHLTRRVRATALALPKWIRSRAWARGGGTGNLCGPKE